MIEETQPVKNDEITHHDIQKSRNCQHDNYATVCLQYCYYFKKYKMIVTDLGKQQKLGANPNVIPKIDFIRNLDWAENTTLFFIFEESNETILNFSQRTVRLL